MIKFVISYQNKRWFNTILRENGIYNLTVLWGLMLAILKTSSYASSNGLQATGVFGSTKLALVWLIYSLMSKASVLEMVLGLVSPNSVSSSSIGTTFPLSVEFRVSKHIIPSKQSSNPSLLSTLAAWALSAFVKIYTKTPCTSSWEEEKTVFSHSPSNFYHRIYIMRGRNLQLSELAGSATDSSAQGQVLAYCRAISHEHNCEKEKYEMPRLNVLNDN